VRRPQSEQGQDHGGRDLRLAEAVALPHRCNARVAAPSGLARSTSCLNDLGVLGPETVPFGPCAYGTLTDVPPGPVADLARQTVDPIVCPILAPLHGSVGVVTVSDEGDVSVLQTTVEDCPPYSTDPPGLHRYTIPQDFADGTVS